MKDRTLFAIFLSVILVLAGISYYFQEADEPTSRAPLEKLASDLEEAYRRRIDINGYAMNYRAEPPDTIVIVVKHYPTVNRRNMTDAVESAKNLIRGMAHDKYGMIHVNIDVQTSEAAIPNNAREMERLERERKLERNRRSGGAG